MGYFSEEEIDESVRRNNAFGLVSAIREGVSIAKKNHQQISYEKAFDLLHDLNPEVYNEIIGLLTQKNESELVRYYKQVAEAKNTSPTLLINAEIRENQELLELVEDNTLIKKKVQELKAANEYFNPRRVSEHRILNHDFSLTSRSSYFETVYENEAVKDYSLGDNRILRLRLLHPDQYEHILGTDLIYEQFDLRYNRVRLIQLQYKAWDSKNLYLDERLIKQVDKMSTHLCKSGYCVSEAGLSNNNAFRLPYCSGFLRPTSNLQNPNSKMITSGDHIPVCYVETLKAKDGKITKENISGNTVGHKIFEDMFINNSLGSRWIPIDELDKFYTEKNILSELENIRLRVQEVVFESDEQKIKRIGRQ